MKQISKTNEQTNKRTNEQTDKVTNEQTRRTDERTDGGKDRQRTNKRTEGRTQKRTNQQKNEYGKIRETTKTNPSFESSVRPVFFDAATFPFVFPFTPALALGLRLQDDSKSWQIGTKYWITKRNT